MSALLETPWATAEQRVTLWQARRDLAAALGARSGSPQTLELWDVDRGVAAERRRAVQRARHSFDLLRLQGGQDLEKLEKALRQASDLPGEDRLAVLAEELRKAWKGRSARIEVAPP
jgi:hypothetical protein